MILIASYALLQHGPAALIATAGSLLGIAAIEAAARHYNADQVPPLASRLRITLSR